jgi:hypothetical protein
MEEWEELCSNVSNIQEHHHRQLSDPIHPNDDLA